MARRPIISPAPFRILTNRPPWLSSWSSNLLSARIPSTEPRWTSSKHHHQPLHYYHSISISQLHLCLLESDGYFSLVITRNRPFCQRLFPSVIHHASAHTATSRACIITPAPTILCSRSRLRLCKYPRRQDRLWFEPAGRRTWDLTLWEIRRVFHQHHLCVEHLQYSPRCCKTRIIELWNIEE